MYTQVFKYISGQTVHAKHTTQMLKHTILEMNTNTYTLLNLLLVVCLMPGIPAPQLN